MSAVAPIAEVSDHAVVRYLERVLLIDMARLRRDIAGHCAAGFALGDAVSLSGKHKYIIKNGVLVTVEPRRGR